MDSIKEKEDTFHNQPTTKPIVSELLTELIEKEDKAGNNRCDLSGKLEKDPQKRQSRLRVLLLLLLIVLLGFLLNKRREVSLEPAPIPVQKQILVKRAPKLSLDTTKQILIKKSPKLLPPIKKQNEFIDFKKNFLQLVSDIENPRNGYLSKEKVPYHSAEKFIVEAVDYGKTSTSEAISVKLWLSVIRAAVTKNWTPFYTDWNNIEKYYIPTPAEQPNANSYLPYLPSTYVSVPESMKKYPAKIEYDKPVGKDPIGDELDAKYESNPYLLHWYIDVDNWYGFEKKKTYVKVDIFARGPHESTFKTIPHPSYDNNASSKNGFVDLYVESKEPQWRYSSAPDAELRIGQAMYWAERIAGEQKIDITRYVKMAEKLGEYSRYALFDKFFRRIGDGDKPGIAYDSCHYLVSWCVAWGGGIENSWAWRIGESQIHAGYQNPLGALYFSQKNISLWKQSVERQLELITWLQSKQGPIGGGVKNDYSKLNGPFHGMQYAEHPVFIDPPSNSWAGWQYFLMDRVAEYYYVSGDKRAEKILERWVGWIIQNTSISDDDVKIPIDLAWSGSPESHNLSCRIAGFGSDVGGAVAYFDDAAFLGQRQSEMEGQVHRNDPGCKKDSECDVE